MLALAASGLAALIILLAASPGAAQAGGGGDRFLPGSRLLLRSAKLVDLHNNIVRLPLHRGTANGKTVWYILTESSDFGLAKDLNVNYSAKLGNIPISCAACVQTVSLNSDPNLKFGESEVQFNGAPDFSPTRQLVSNGASSPAPKIAQPGAVAGPGYSPFIRIAGSSVVYNAPIVATGDGPFDVKTHSNTADRVLAIHPAVKVRGGQYSQATVDILFVRGFDAGKPIFYLSTEASDPVAATLERATYTPVLNGASFRGGDDALGSGRERIFVFTNGQNGNAQAQGIGHLIADGHASENASLDNRPLLDALRKGGDLLNVLGDFPTLSDPRHSNAYSPLWDAQFGEWSKKALSTGQATRQTDENQILNLAANRPDLLTGPGGADYGSVGFVINCPVIGFAGSAPEHALAEPTPLGQF
ncbi:MAG: hypothetical protein M3022_17710 [Actinomycetota bacterium]|nr:hypothetical protein [Actinomycetota bacterium]